MLRKILSYGLIAGLVAGIPVSAVAIAGHRTGMSEAASMAISYLIMLIALSLVFVAVKRRRDVELGGVIRFWPALGLGIGISAFAGIVYVAAFEALAAITHFNFALVYSNGMIEQARASGASASELAAVTAKAAEIRAQLSDPLFLLPMVFAEIFPVGLLVSLVSAGLLRNPRFLPARRREGLGAG
jgi:hypothetical protein